MNKEQQKSYEINLSTAVDHLRKCNQNLAQAVQQLNNCEENEETRYHLRTLQETHGALSSLLYPGDPDGYIQ